jgi:PAS domain S-box-containing protein
MPRHARAQKVTDVITLPREDRRKPPLRSASDQLWEVSSHLDLVLNSLTDHAILTLDVSGHITSWNRGAQRTKGYDQSEILGCHFSRFYTKADQDAGVPMRGLRLANEIGKHECEGWRVRKNGELFWAQVLIHPVRDVCGELRGFVKVTRDVSQRLQVDKLREELSQSQKLEMVGQLTGGVAHDFNNLLTTIEAGHDLMLAYTHDERVGRILDINRDAVARSKKLIGQLLAFSRRQVLVPKRSNMFNLISSLDALLQRAVGENIRLRWNLSPELPAVLVDQAQFQAVLLNLVVNARDAMPDGGWLTIFMDTITLKEDTYPAPFNAQPGEYVVLGVSDTGTGMTPEVQARAIEPFFTTKPVGRGTGLGLSQCFGFARQSGGTMRIDTVVGKGTTIRILLPASPMADTAPDVKKQRTILFVDDDSSIRTLVSEVLRTSGHTVIEAEDGHTALNLLQSDDSIDYLFTDIVMPNDMNGVQLMTAARAKRPGLPTLLASGYPREALRDLGQIPEDVMFIAKPYSLSDLNAHLMRGSAM